MGPSDHWKEISALYAAALERPDTERDAFLHEACGGDEDLLREVTSLLDCHADAQQTLTSTAAHVIVNAMSAEAVSLAGRQLGAYRLEAPLATGGMGEVYRAVDTRLHRPVAIKILPHHLREDAARRERFEREAQAVAALHHPHICVLHDLGQADGIDFLVMELLEGETLADRLTRGPMPVEEALQHAVVIADALVATHRAGIVHRDLKPANIMLTESGAKLLDFGLAKLRVDGAGDEEDFPAAVASPRADRRSTTVLGGTLPYMTPEQLDRKEVDHRSDIFAFGAVLCEMVTGQRAFDGADRETVLNAIKTGVPVAVPPHISAAAPGLDTLLQKCLRKDPADRWQDAETMTHALRAVAAAAMPPARSASRATLAAVVLATVIVAALAVWALRQSGGLKATVEAPSLVVGRQQQLTAADEIEFDPSFSPDSNLIAYSVGHGARFRIVVRAVETNREIPVPGDQDGLQFQPRWSPDGNALLYLARDGVFVWPLGGGEPRRIASPSDAPGTYTTLLRGGPAITAATWSPDGREIAVAYGGTLVAVETDGRSRRQLATSPDELHWCDWSPRDTWIACTAGNLHLPYIEHYLGNIAPSSIVLVPTGGGQLIEIAPKTAMNQSPIWSADGRRLYFVSNRHGTSDIYGIDVGEDGTPVGDAVRLTTGLGAYSIAISGDRERLAYAQLTARGNLWSLPIPITAVPVDIAGARQLTSANQLIESMHVTPDRKWLVYDSNLYGNSDIFRMPLNGGEPTRLTTDPADDFAPDVSADGRWLAFHSFRTKSRDIFVQPFEGGPAQQVTATAGQESFPVWLPDESLAFIDQAVKADGQFQGTFLTQRNPRGGWEPPKLLLPRAAGLTVTRDGFIYALDTIIYMSRRDDAVSRVIYRPNPPELPRPVQLGVGDDGETVYFKAHDAAGRASFWVLPLTGAPPRMLVRFDDLSRPSRRWDFAVADGRFFFTIDERRSNIWLAETSEH